LAKFQIWLLHRGVPSSQEDVSPYYERQMRDPFLLGLQQNWWHKIWMSILSWWRRKQLPQLPQVCSNDPAEEQARELERILGQDYECRTVYRYQGISAEERIKELPRGVTVLLIAMEPFRSGVSESMFAAAKAALQAQNQDFMQAPLLSEVDDYVEAYLETIRISLLENQILVGKYAIVLLITKDARNWNQPQFVLEKSFFEFTSRITEKLDSTVPIYRSINHPAALDKLSFSPEITDIIYGFPNWVCSSMQKPPNRLAEKGYKLHAIPAFNQHPSFIRSLAEIAWEQTDNHPSQSVS